MKGAGASLAWLQACHPELDWVGIDPTNQKRLFGAPSQSLVVEVTVARIG